MALSITGMPVKKSRRLTNFKMTATNLKKSKEQSQQEVRSKKITMKLTSNKQQITKLS